MPTRKRRAREREIAAERGAVAAQFDILRPIHVAERLGRPSKLLEALSTKDPHYKWNGLRVDDETGVVFRPPAPEGQGANVERAEEAMDRARELRREYGPLWNIRGGAKEIAAQAKLSLSTVHAHMARLRKS